LRPLGNEGSINAHDVRVYGDSFRDYFPVGMEGACVRVKSFVKEAEACGAADAPG
jgi:hypothetical protein